MRSPNEIREAARALRRAADGLDGAADSLEAGASQTATACVNLAGEALDRAYDVVCGPEVAPDECDCHTCGVCRVCGRVIPVQPVRPAVATAPAKDWVRDLAAAVRAER